MSETIPLLDQIAADEYWGQPQPIPHVDRVDATRDGMTSTHSFAAYGAELVQVLFRRARREEHAIEPIATGQQLPLVERGMGLLKLVEDSRRVVNSASFLEKVLSKSHEDQSPDEFEDLAAAMVRNRFYIGDSAVAKYHRTDGGQSFRILRHVHYVTGSSSGEQLQGITSSMLTESPERIPMNLVIPPLTVGSTYELKSGGRRLNRIIQAEILLPDGIRKKSPARVATRQRSAKPLFSF